MAVGELALLPAVRAASAETLIVADGFSCREQIAQATSRRAVHLAEALRGALRGQRTVGNGPRENAYVPASPDGRNPRALAAAALIGIGVALGAFAVVRIGRS
jgi:hypothetical protein